MYIWADASQDIGYGHFTRSLALADMLKADFDCTFFTQYPTNYQKKEVLKVCKLIELPDTDEKFNLFLKVLRGDEIVVLDNYFFSSDYQNEIRKCGCKLVCIGSNDKHYYADVVINYILSSHDFSAEPYTRFCTGIEWAILRKPFWISSPVRDFRPTVERIVICFGGTDQFLLTEKVVRFLRSYFNKLEIHVVSTDVLGEIRISSLANEGVELHINASAQHVHDLFEYCDLAILSASTVVLEALACRIPVLVGYYVANQERLYEYLERELPGIGLGNLLDASLEMRVIDVLKGWSCKKSQLILSGLQDSKAKYLELFKTL